ncbi:Gfo/Idh/MocA family protein [Candidatus Enterococcus ferrettii]|uniref:Gfo/Idh/MocA family oxidoreductase n=1 Tax=Candidatus Enterococcus ferrettii TaxID=2815324 RepID=A0ABV0ELS1_9ENTE|nr:Gfo/Idh/MocA family oxidoreductase [Enterococcus sp. 665A]MBO1338354.1 Gfo/Idh/MocA family oxidoreductase [Enterococcus sp. 665A]
MTIRYGIISTAQVVPRFVAGVKESMDGEVTAIASRQLAKAEKMAQELAIPNAYGSYEELCQSDEVDIVYVAVYNKGHFDAAKLALEHDKHVLLEKPFTMTRRQAEELFAMAEEKHLFLMEAQKSVFLPITEQVVELLAKDTIGKVHWMKAVMAYPNIYHINWFSSLDAGGGILRGAGTYPLEYMQFLMQQAPNEVKGTMVFPPEKSDTQANLSVTFSDNTIGSLFMTVDLDLPAGITLYGEKGQIYIPNFWKTKEAEVTYPDGRIEKIIAPFQSEFVFEVEHVNECLKQKRLTSPVVTKEMTVQTVRIIEEMYQHYQK